MKARERAGGQAGGGPGGGPDGGRACERCGETWAMSGASAHGGG